VTTLEDAKRAARSRVRAARRARGAEERAAVAGRLADAVLALPEVDVLARAGAGTVSAYASFRGEPGTAPLVDRLRAEGVRVLLPVVVGAVGDGLLEWAEYDGPATVATYDRGIPEPVGPRLPGAGADALLAAGVRVVLLPATAAGTDGRRLGQGGGFYDRVLAGLPRWSEGGPLRVALVHDDELVPAGEVPAGEDDAPVDVVVTDRRTVRVDPA
jgi:5-formyltetrahydrofolate cyclo-ligase